MYLKQLSQKIVGATGFIAAAQLAKFIKLSIVVGSYTAFFSFNNCLLPLAGAFGGIMGASLVTFGKIILGILMHGGLLPLASLAFYVPGFFAAAYWASSSWFIRLCIPLICMALFVMHPTGGQVWLYAMYWWIPVILYFMPRHHIFSTAFGSTFVAHAVGSVIWLYTVPMTALAWWTLLPMVIIERLLFAAGAVLLYKGIDAVRTMHTVPFTIKIRHLA